jgi:hypothetical protein
LEFIEKSHHEQFSQQFLQAHVDLREAADHLSVTRAPVEELGMGHPDILCRHRLT